MGSQQTKMLDSPNRVTRSFFSKQLTRMSNVETM